MKILRRIRLINWLSFGDETILIGQNTLMTGQNSAGKSTIMDAAQLVLTQNQKHFNPAGNEANKRDIKGYVRYRTGKESATYKRNGYVVAYVALEFEEESTGRCFVTGVKCDSPSETERVKTKWFAEPGCLEDFSFIVDGRPARDKEFKLNGEPVSFMSQNKEAEKKFRSLYGRLDNRYAFLIPQALGMKSVGNFTEFVNNFLLPEADIDVEKLSRNLTILKELQEELDDMVYRKEQLTAIRELYSKYCAFLDEKETNSILAALIHKAQLEDDKKQESLRQTELLSQTEQLQITEDALNQTLISLREQHTDLIVTRKSNNANQLIQTLEEKLNNERFTEKRLVESEFKLRNNIEPINQLIDSPYFSCCAITNTANLVSASIDYAAKLTEVSEIEKYACSINKRFKEKEFELLREINVVKNEINVITNEINRLKSNIRSYPVPGVQKLKTAIEKEFSQRNIDSNVYVFADRLEIVDGMEEWQNAVEGFLGKRRFNLIVEPKYFDIALGVYDRYKNEISGVSLVNTKKLKIDKQINKNSLAAVVHSNNKYVLAYAHFLLDDIIRCNSVYDLENHHKAITAECMVYTQLAVSKINEDIYRVPYIGKKALEDQLNFKTCELEDLQIKKIGLDKDCAEAGAALVLLNNCHFDIVKEYLNVPNELAKCRDNISKYEIEIKDAKADPSIAEIQKKIEKIEKEISECNEEYRKVSSSKAIAEHDAKMCSDKINELTEAIVQKDNELALIKDTSVSYYEMAASRFSAEVVNKIPFETVLKKIKNREDKLNHDISTTGASLFTHQQRYRNGEYGSGPDVMPSFEKEWQSLADTCIEDKRDSIKQYEEKNIIQFKESFLAKMRENIARAQHTFSDLNKHLKNVYYGNDNYQFKIEGNKDKFALYKMIMSDLNTGGSTLFSTALEQEYRDEMEELFEKIRVSNDSNMKTAREYTDYRNYLQYDIVISNKDGEKKLLSKNAGYTSGGETQTPCYVAIAASFAQAYNTGSETIRLILIDEAFSKMDDDRISALMNFLSGQGFQLIIAAPPDKTSVLSDYMDKINIVMKDKDGGISTVESLSRE